MSKLHTLKHEDLVTEFTRYVADNPEFLDHIPNESLIVLLDKRDPEFCAYAVRQARRTLKHDDRPNRPITYIDVGKLAPPKSRILKPRILRKAPQFAQA